jgi:polysaccharide biosynthesis/export protein
MFRLLAFFIACLSGAALVSAQTAANYTNTSGSSVRTASPEAKAEAKRLYKEGVKYGLAGLFQQAVEVLKRAVMLDPQHADAHYALGHAYFDLKQWRNAIESLKAAVALNPKDAEARDRLGLARAMLWEEDNAKLIAQRPKIVPKAVPQSEPKFAEPKPAEPKLEPKTAEPKTNPNPEGQQVSIVAKVPQAPEVSAEPSEEINAAAANELALTKIYRVGPSDVLDIRINDSSSPQSTLFTVTPAGFVEHPLIAEPIHAGGLTVDEIGSNFESELKRRALIDNPKVTVGVRDYASHTILVSGLVKDSGTKILRREAIPLYVVVADAQPLPEAARVTVLRNESNQTFEIELAEAGEMNLLVRPGDVITLHPHVTQFVYIGGEVKLPGEKTYRRGLTLTQALISAGGVTPKAKEARVGRDDGNGFLVVNRYKLKDIESGKVPDPVVKPGDRIVIRD